MAQLGSRVDGDSLALEEGTDVGEGVGLQVRPVQQQRLHRVTGCRVVALRVPDCIMQQKMENEKNKKINKPLKRSDREKKALTDAEGFADVRRLVDVHVADPVRVTQDRDVATLVFDHLHQLIGSSRNHQIDVRVQLQEVTHVLPRVHLLIVIRGSMQSISESVCRQMRRRIVKEGGGQSLRSHE